jgi:hypothetical protein
MALLGLLPNENNYAGLVEISKAVAHLSLTEEESKELEVKFEAGQIQWNTEKALSMNSDVPMGEWMLTTLRGILVELDKAASLAPDQATLFEKFVLDYQ